MLFFRGDGGSPKASAADNHKCRDEDELKGDGEKTFIPPTVYT